MTAMILTHYLACFQFIKDFFKWSIKKNNILFIFQNSSKSEEVHASRIWSLSIYLIWYSAVSFKGIDPWNRLTQIFCHICKGAGNFA